MPGHVRKERPLAQKIDERAESPCRDPFPPVLTTDPVTDESLVVLNPPSDAPGNLVAEQDGSGDVRVIGPEPGAPIRLSDVTPDGRFLAFDSGGVLLLVPTAAGAGGAREAIEYVREEYIAVNATFSPDGKAIAYLSDESDRTELYLRSFDPVSGKVGAAKRKVTSDGADGFASWRADSKELYYSKEEQNGRLMMAVDVSTAPAPRASAPKVLFRTVGQPTGDGQRFLVVMPR